MGALPIQGHRRSTVLRKASFNKKRGALPEEVEDTGILLMTDGVFQTAQGKSFKRKAEVENVVRKCDTLNCMRTKCPGMGTDL